MSNANILLNPEKTWIRSTTVWAAFGVLVVGAFLLSGFVAEMRNAVSTIKETISRDAKIHEEDRVTIVNSIREVRDELRRMVLDSVATRQAQQWIELARAANKAKYPDLIWPDLPR